jgi:hypothetical protein
MSTAVDTSLVREIKEDQTKKVWLLFVAIVFVAGGYWLVTGDFSSTRRGAIAAYIGWASLIFFGVGALAFVYMLLRPGMPISLSPMGIMVPRFSRDTLPWAGVTDVSEQRMYSQKYVDLALDPVVAQNLTLKSNVRFFLAGKAPSKITVSAGTLQITHGELLSIIVAYAKAHGGDALAARLTSKSARLARQS